MAINIFAIWAEITKSWRTTCNWRPSTMSPSQWTGVLGMALMRPMLRLLFLPHGLHEHNAAIPRTSCLGEQLEESRRFHHPDLCNPSVMGLLLYSSYNLGLLTPSWLQIGSCHLQRPLKCWDRKVLISRQHFSHADGKKASSASQRGKPGNKVNKWRKAKLWADRLYVLKQHFLGQLLLMAPQHQPGDR